MVVAVGEAARRGLLVRSGEALQALASVTTVVFDKTGTLTMGRPELTAVQPLADADPDVVLRLAAAVQARFPQVRRPKQQDICYATQNRQAAVRWLAQYADHVLVLGDPTSSNSQRLVEVAMAEGVVAMLASSIDTVPESWLTAATVLGLTAGASTPDHLVQAAVARFVGAGVPEIGRASCRERV